MAKRVRMLLRVSSNQQLEADGDLSVQRQLVKEYIEGQPDWILDEKEYFEGSCSGYKNGVADRDVLQEALKDARAGKYEILVAYKDDRIGRRMWEIGSYVMTLKSLGVDIYTVKDGCISPESDDIMGQMMLALRYGNAQKSSSDTGMRVKDTAQKLVRKGKFMGGAPPYGYRLELSGEISKHGRALHHLVVIPEQAEMVKYIYDLSLNKGYGSAKIARHLNEEEAFKALAPRDLWKSGTVTSILTNPIYTGHTAYKRRERINGRYRRLDSGDWILSSEPNREIAIIDRKLWERTQEKRRQRAAKYAGAAGQEGDAVRHRGGGALALTDVLYCGCCGGKMTNGSRYNYWTLRTTGERKKSKTAMYKCQRAWQGLPHGEFRQLPAKEIEPEVLSAVAKQIERLLRREDILEWIREKYGREKGAGEARLKKEEQELSRLQKKLEILERHIPEAMAGEYPLELPELLELIKRHREEKEMRRERVDRRAEELESISAGIQAWEGREKKLPTWREVFLQGDTATKRMVINQLVERIEVTETELTIRFKIGPE